MSETVESREEIIAEAKRLRAEIEQYFNDIAHWNDSVRKPEEEPIDGDPGGTLRGIAKKLDGIIGDD